MLFRSNNIRINFNNGNENDKDQEKYEDSGLSSGKDGHNIGSDNDAKTGRGRRSD